VELLVKMKIQHITEKYWRADEPKPKKRKPSRKHQQRHPGQTRGMVGDSVKYNQKPVVEMGDVEGTDAYKSLEREAFMMLKYLHNDYVKSGRVNAFELPKLLRQHMPEISKPQSYTFFSKFIDKKLYLDEGDVVDISTPLPAGFINWLKTKDLTVGVLKDRVKMRKLRLQYEKETGRKVNEYNSLEESVGQSITEAEFDRLAEKKDACYHKVKSRYKVWPSAYASGALVQCRKKGAKNWGNKSKKK